MLREELMLLQEPGSYVGEVVKVMGKSKVLVKARLAKRRFHLPSLPSVWHRETSASAALKHRT